MPPTWRIYYADGSTFDSTQGGPEEAPLDGFVCAVGYRCAATSERYITYGKNHYFYNEEGDEWWGIDWHGMLDRARMYSREKSNPFWAYKEGRMVDDDRFRELMALAHRDPDFPQRKG